MAQCYYRRVFQTELILEKYQLDVRAGDTL